MAQWKSEGYTLQIRTEPIMSIPGNEQDWWLKCDCRSRCLYTWKGFLKARLTEGDISRYGCFGQSGKQHPLESAELWTKQLDFGVSSLIR